MTETTDKTSEQAAVTDDRRVVDRVVAFFIDSQRYGIPIDHVQEIQQIVAFSEVPGAGSGVVGMVNLRGHVIPAVDMRRIMGLAAAEYTLETPMIICRIDDQLVAIIVDEVQDVLQLSPECLQGPPAMHALASKMIAVARMDEGLVYVMDVQALLGHALSGSW